MANENESELRYGISALDLKYKDYAENDELMVRGSDGKIYYKRETDGQIVSYETSEYTKKEIASDIKRALSNISIHYQIHKYQTNSIIYNTMNLTGISVLDTYNISRNNTFTLSTDPIITNDDNINTFMYFRIRGNQSTNAIMSYVKHIYDKNFTGSDDKLTEVSINYSLNLILENDETVETSGIINMPYNELTCIKLSVPHNVKRISVTVKEISYPIISSIYGTLPDDSIQLISYLNNYSNIIESNKLDIIYYINEIPSFDIYNNDNLSLEFIMPSSEIDTKYFITISPDNIIFDKDNNTILDYMTFVYTDNEDGSKSTDSLEAYELSTETDLPDSIYNIISEL